MKTTRNRTLYASFLVSVAAVAAASAAITLTDDFNDGNDDGWTQQSPLTDLGAPAVFSFPGGNSYQIHADPQTVDAQFGAARAGSLRLDASYSSFQQSVDVVNWDNSQSGLTIGMLARTSNPGFGTTSGYSLTTTLSGVFEIFRVTNESPLVLVATASIGALNPANDYRLVFTGDGSLLTGQIFNLEDLATPLATISGSEATYASGNSGIIVYSNNGTQTATATFDNYFSAIPEPSTALLSGLGLLALLLRRCR